MDEWYGQGWRKPHYGEALHAARIGAPGARDGLLRLLADPEGPAIVRATGLYELAPYVGRESIGAVLRGLSDTDPLVRRSAVAALEAVPASDRLPALPLLDDPIRAVRVEAARQLAPVTGDMVSDEQASAIEAGIAELEESLMVDADRASAHMTLGAVLVDRERFEEAEAAYRTALRLDPRFGPAAVNLSDLYRLQGRDAEGERVLVDFLSRNPDDGPVHHSLGLLLVRERRYQEALVELGRAAELRPDDPRYAYVYGVGLQSVGDVDGAIEVFESTLERHSNDPEILYALVSIHAQAGRREEALGYARRLAEVRPDDPDVRAVVTSLQ
jgi:Flp pilus assembly protein TadD